MSGWNSRLVAEYHLGAPFGAGDQRQGTTIRRYLRISKACRRRRNLISFHSRAPSISCSALRGSSAYRTTDCEFRLVWAAQLKSGQRVGADRAMRRESCTTVMPLLLPMWRDEFGCRLARPSLDPSSGQLRLRRCESPGVRDDADRPGGRPRWSPRQPEWGAQPREDVLRTGRASHRVQTLRGR